MTEPDGNKELIRRYYQALNGGDPAALDALDELFTDGYINHGSPINPPGAECGSAAGRQTVRTVWERFPGAYMNLEEIIAEGDRVAVRWRLESVGYRGVVAPGVPTLVKVSGQSFYRIEAGRIAERWVALSM
jgi:predicted ester cyclase